MRNKKHITLICMNILFIILAMCIHYFMNGGIKGSRINDTDGICINEVCGNYFPTSFSETQPASDWIELYNYSDKSIDLGKYYLSDNKDNLYKYKLPSIEFMPNSYYVIHSNCEDLGDVGEMLNFKISSQGETLYLSSQQGILDKVYVPAIDTNTTWSRLTDGGSEWGNTEITYRSSNNNAEKITKKISPPVFSAASGFYNDNFELELMVSSGCNIYYTLDGSVPDNKSILYTKPILIHDMSKEPNIFSARNDFDLSCESSAGNTVEKITVIRAIAIDESGKKSNVITHSYIIGKNHDPAYSEMYTVSLVTDPHNLFDYNEGIYILGKSFDDYVSTGVSNTPEQPNANYNKKGKNSERPASIEIFNESGECILDREVGIRIHGHTTRECTQKSFSVYARKMYDGENTIENLFGEDMTIHKFFIYTNREGTKLRDALIASSLTGRDMATQSFIYCNVFLDGEYWGIYLLAEVYDEYYFKNHFDIGMDNIQICESASPPDVVEYLSTISDRSDISVYEKICQMIDIESFIDYYAAMLYLNNNDWLFYNAICYRSIENGSGKNEDGKWRWGVWDTETAMYDAHINTFCTGHTSSWREDPLAQVLMEQEVFKKQFVNTYMDLYNNIWQEDRILPIVYEMKNNIESSYAKHMDRYNTKTAINEYTDKLETFLKDRSQYAFKHLKEEFDLQTDPAWVVILPNLKGAASYRLNTSFIDMPEAWWQGLYFPDYPIDIKIEEIYGNNIFLGWYTEDGTLLSTEETLTFNLEEGTNLVFPKFKENSP